MPINIALLNWGDLCNNLRKRVSDEVYFAGKTAVSVDTTQDNKPLLALDDGTQHTFALLIFADGYRSMPPGLMQQEEENRLKQLMRDHLPTYYADIVAASSNTFAQPIYNVGKCLI